MSTMRYQWILYVLGALLVLVSADVSLSPSGMTVLKAVYGASCGVGRAMRRRQSALTDYIKEMCDGRDTCSGNLPQDVVTEDLEGCRGDLHVVAVCEHGEIRSASVEGEAVGQPFSLDCSLREIPAFRQHPDWMASMENVLANRTIKQLRFVGTHHSGTSSFDMPFYHLAKCQNVTVGQQLIAGVRYLDYRLGTIQDTYGARITHGVLHGHLFLKDLLEIWAFSQLHPREFFMVDLQKTHELNHRMQRQLRVWIYALFRRTAIARGSINIRLYTMQDVWDTGRRVLFLHDNPRSYLHWRRDLLRNRWPNVCYGDTLANNAENELYLKDRFNSRVIMLQWLISVKFSCLTSLYPRSMAIREEGLQWLEDNNHPFTIVSTDFTLQPLNQEGLVEQVINSNLNILVDT